MGEDTAVAGLGRETVFDFQPVVAINRVGDEMPFGIAQADKHAVTNNERAFQVRIVVHLGNIYMLSVQILAVEQTCGFLARPDLARQTCRRDNGYDDELLHGFDSFSSLWSHNSHYHTIVNVQHNRLIFKKKLVPNFRRLSNAGRGAQRFICQPGGYRISYRFTDDCYLIGTDWI